MYKRDADVAARNEALWDAGGLTEQEWPLGTFNAKLQPYYDLKPEDFLDANGDVAWWRFEDAREAALSVLTPDERALFDADVVARRTGPENQVRAELSLVHDFRRYIDPGFWQWLKANSSHPVAQSLPEGWQNFGSYSEWYGYMLRGLTTELVETRGLEIAVANAAAQKLLGEVTKDYMSARSKLRKAYITEQPEVANLLAKYYTDLTARETLEEAFGELPPELQTGGGGSRRRRRRSRRP